jgi:hypothetical protein
MAYSAFLQASQIASFGFILGEVLICPTFLVE